MFNKTVLPENINTYISKRKKSELSMISDKETFLEEFEIRAKILCSLTDLIKTTFRGEDRDVTIVATSASTTTHFV